MRRMTLRHYDHDDRVRFITFSTHLRLPTLMNDRVRLVLAQTINDVRMECRFRLFAYVFMPEHIHLVLLPDEQSSIGPLIGEIKRISSKRIHECPNCHDAEFLQAMSIVRGGSHRFAFWMRRCFDHNCRSEEFAWDKITYCHYNPVKRGLVQNPEEWMWSSYNWYQGKTDVPLRMDILMQ